MLFVGWLPVQNVFVRFLYYLSICTCRGRIFNEKIAPIMHANAALGEGAFDVL